ncbi:MAG: Rossmann-like domain-containing protein [Desulfosudaceae bacterium]
MRLNQRLLDLFADQARATRVEELCLGLGYTAAATSDGGVGIAYTFFQHKSSCMPQAGYENPEGQSAIGLLENITSADPLARTMALAVLNALNASRLAEITGGPDAAADNQDLLELLAIGPGTRVAMVGAIKPLIRLIKDRGGEVAVRDEGKGIGAPDDLQDKLADWAEVLILTSTSILNNTTEKILAAADSPRQTVLLGPSTPLVPEAFADLPVDFLAGTLPLDRANTFRAVRHGRGKPVIQKFGRKVLLPLKK